jgi:hypothetical protein
MAKAALRDSPRTAALAVEETGYGRDRLELFQAATHRRRRQ